MMINVTLKDGVVKQYEQGTTAAEVAKSLGAGLYKAACAAKVDGKAVDLRTPLESDCTLSILTFDAPEGKHAFWHTASHVLAQAVMRLYPDTKYTIGPAVENGFYYDFDTRAEISDVANAIYDGTSAIMLSGETAAGAYPVEALKTMSAIAERTEQENHARFVPLTESTGKISVSDATAHAACLTAKDVNAAAIVTVSESGNTARLLSKYRPEQPIIACVMKEQVQRQLALSWGITPLMMPLAHSTDELIEMSTSLAKENGYLHNGELAVVTAGVPVGVSGTTNMIKIHMVGNCLATGVGVGRENADVTSATGKACVCRTLEEVRAKFKPGMVLVVPSTSNEMLSYVRDAAALVVEEPGLNSHAAIAGKALLKPTVVGAAGATSHIRDGLMIAVDCAHGSVQRLQA